VEGHDVVELLQKAFDKQNLLVRIAALCNDTVGTLVTRYFDDSKAAMGVILGTGSNACYWEKIKNIPKLKQPHYRDDDEMIINMEWGNFGHAASQAGAAIPLTAFDRHLDQRTPNPGMQIYEKLMSGLYLGEIARLVLVHLASEGVIPVQIGRALFAFGDLDSSMMSPFLADKSQSLEVIQQWFTTLGIAESSLADRQVIQEICWLVMSRAARLAAVAIATVTAKMGCEQDCTISIDGSVFEKLFGFKEEMERALNELLPGAHNIRLALTTGGSGVGAGLIAALTSVSEFRA
jgi:hexokinase